MYNSPAVLVRDVLLHGPPFLKVIIPLRSLSAAAATVVVCHPECHVYYPVNALPLGGLLSRSAASLLFRRIRMAAAEATVGID